MMEARIIVGDPGLQATLITERLVVLVAATTGQGDEPDNMKVSFTILIFS